MKLYFEKNTKFYEIYVAKNLLGDIQITRRFGRKGTRGRCVHEVCNTWQSLHTRLNKLIKHRTIVRGYVKK